MHTVSTSCRAYTSNAYATNSPDCGMSSPGDYSELSIAPSDVVFVSVVQFGRTILNSVAFTNKSSVDEILHDVRSLLGGVTGMVKVTLRNRTVGWHSILSMRLWRPSMSLLATA